MSTRAEKRELLRLTKKEIERRCKHKKISISGRKIDMIERLLNTPYVEPSSHEVSRTALQLLVCGYMRESSNKADQDSSVLAELCVKYYDRQLYVMLLNNEDLQLSLLDTAHKDCKLSSNNVQTKEFGSKEKVCICHKTDFNAQQFIKGDNNRKYNAVFKANCDFLGEIRDCGLILYPSDTRPDMFESHYYTLPDLPWKLSHEDDLIYSDKYGLIFLASAPESNDAFGDIYSLNLETKEKESMSWNTDKLPKPLRFVYRNSGNYCLINENETELFIVNGSTEYDARFIEQTSIYNLETKEYTILANNPNPSIYSGIIYHRNSNKVYIAGGEHQDVYYYDMHKNQYIINTFGYSHSSHQNPKLYLNEQGSILHIASFGDHVSHEWIDLRANKYGLRCKWTRNKSIGAFQLWADYHYMSIVDLQ